MCEGQNADGSLSLASPLLISWKNRQLIFRLVKREILARYRGSLMGIAWSFFNPLLMLSIYTFVFSSIFRARWGLDGGESKTDYAIMLFIGMIVYGLFAECVNRAPGLILSNVNYVKKVVFPLEILSWVVLGSALFHGVISLLMLLLVQVVLRQSLPWTVVFFPLVFLPLAFMLLGLIWFLSALAVYVRDIGQVVGIFTTAMLFLSPVFYPAERLPEGYRDLLYLNPLTSIMEESRRVLFLGHPPDWWVLLVMLCVGVVVAFGGFWWFQKVRKGFADVL